MLISVTVFGVSTSRRLASAIRTAARKRPGVTEVTPWNTRWKWNGLRYAACARSRRLCGSPRRSRIAVSARTTASTRAVAVGPFGTVSRPRPGHVGALVSIMRARRRPSSGGGPAPAPRAVARQHRTLGARWALVQVDGHDHRHGHDRVVEQVQLDTWEPELEHAGGHRPAEQVPARDRLAEQEQVLEVVPELDHESDGPPPTRPPDERRPQQRQPQQHDGREPVVQLLGPEQPGEGLAEVLEPVPGDDRHEDQQHRTVQRSVQAPCEGPTRQRDDVWLGGHLRLLLLATILVSRVVKVRGAGAGSPWRNTAEGRAGRWSRPRPPARTSRRGRRPRSRLPDSSPTTRGSLRASARRSAGPTTNRSRRTAPGRSGGVDPRNTSRAPPGPRRARIRRTLWPAGSPGASARSAGRTRARAEAPATPK